MITRFHVQNYKALRDVTLDLTPVHVLIGPNDSGKTSILEALAALSRSVDHDLNKSFLGRWAGTELVWRGDPGLKVILSAVTSAVGATPGERHSLAYELTVRFDVGGRLAKVAGETLLLDGESKALDVNVGAHQSCVMQQGNAGEIGRASWQVFTALRGVQYYRWDARMLALPVAQDMNRRFRMEPSGFGLAMCLDDILGHDRERFSELENRFRKVFPAVRAIRLMPQPAYKSPLDHTMSVPRLQDADGKGIFVDFCDGPQDVAASQLSDGLLLVLAYLAILYLPHPPRLLLLEELESGIHPARLKQVVQIIRDIAAAQQHTQILLTTHSPYAVDHFEPSEVSLCQKLDDGSIAVRRLSESKTVREQLDVFSLGEIWSAEGEDRLMEDSLTAEEAGS